MWSYFFAGQNPEDLEKQTAGLGGTKTYYAVHEVIPRQGHGALSIRKGACLIRLECEEPLAPACSAKAALKGMTRHLQYTSAEVRSDLAKRSAAEFPSAGNPFAVLIPIRKSAVWWDMAQDMRQKHFERSGNRNHMAVGYDFADKIYRKLYHARYFENPEGYDFLTYFEFPAETRPVFESLLAELRDTQKNPEWGFVDYEVEIWTVKTEGKGQQS